VLIFVLAPAFSWKLFVAIGVPLRFRVHVPGPVMFPPMFVITNDPTASGAQFALIETAGACADAGAAHAQSAETTAAPRDPTPDRIGG
jgi:hypothetical protein